MIRTSISLLAFVSGLAACGNGPSGDLDKYNAGVEAFKAETRAIWKTRNRVEYQGQIFDVAVNSEKKYALVQPKSAFDFANVEGVAGQVSGCDTRTELGILTSMTGNVGSVDFSKIKVKTGGVRAYRVELLCKT